MNNKRKEELLSKGLCTGCAKNKLVSKVLCQECLDKMKLYGAKKRLKLKENGICIICRNNPVVDMITCEECNAKQKKRRNELKEKGLCSICGKNPLINVDACEKCYARQLKARKNKSKIIKEKVYLHYGGYKCNCPGCNITEPLALTIDHVNNDGNKHRKKRYWSIFGYLYKNNFPEGFQVLCYNCNCGRARNNGICPIHKFGTSINLEAQYV